MINYLKDISVIFAGHSIRSKIKPNPKGKESIVQMANISLDGVLDWKSVERIDLAAYTGSRGTRFLENGDIVFKARGNNHQAAVIRDCREKTVASPHLLIIRLNPDSGLLPEFVAWQINQFPLQQYFSNTIAARGGVTKGMLSFVPIDCINLPEQRKALQEHEEWLRKKHEIQKKLEKHNAYSMDIAKRYLHAAQ